MNSKIKEAIGNFYLYLVTFIGLMMVIIPTVDLIKVGLETWVFPLAVEDEFSFERRPPEPFMVRANTKDLSEADSKNIELSEDDVNSFEQWKEDYKTWQETQKNKDFTGIRLQRDLVRDISTLIVGLALFLSHGSIVRKRRNS